jgi:hypothetical protein
MYSFRVMCSPGAVVVYGDIGELFFLKNLGWLRAQMGCGLERVPLMYMFEKMPHGMRPSRFSPELAMEDLQERIASLKERAEDELENKTDLLEEVAQLKEVTINDPCMYGESTYYEFISDLKYSYPDDYPSVREMACLYEIACLWVFCQELEKLLAKKP